MSNPLSPEMFKFLQDLAANNNREWFAANKERYRKVVQRPMVEFIESMAPWFAEYAPPFIADTRLNGGSLFRIYRDTRFGADKTPFKTNVACQFRHRAGKDAHAPGYYVHLSNEEIFFGGGIWAPPTPVLNEIRNAILDDPGRWAGIKQAPRFLAIFGGLGQDEMLKTAPRGYDKDSPYIDDLRLKSIYAFGTCTQSEVSADDFPDRVMEAFLELVPLMRFITDSLGLEWD